MTSQPRSQSALALLLGACLLTGLSGGCETPSPPVAGPSPSAQTSASAVASAIPSVASSTVEPGAARPAAKKPDNAVVIGEKQTFRSTILGEDRTIWVHTPASYEHGKAAYPVLYLLDGESNFHHTTGITEFLGEAQRAPEMIVVGVNNTVRDRDLSPTALKDRPGSGGAAKFLAFLKDELRPRIEGSYRTSPYRVLVGHSLGGLFGIYALTTAPDAFNAYVCISPSLWWDDQLMQRESEAFFTKRPDLKAFLYFTVGNEPGRMLDGNKSFAAMLKAKAPKGLQWQFKQMDRENHGTTPHRSTYDALEALFESWEPPPGIDTLKALLAHYEAISKKFLFEVKPSEAILNNFGYKLMEKSPGEALAAFKLNVQENPDSANVYDSLGDAYEKSGKLDLAKANYEIAVRKATEVSDPLLPAFKKNLERMSAPAAK